MVAQAYITYLLYPPQASKTSSGSKMRCIPVVLIAIAFLIVDSIESIASKNEGIIM